MHTHGHGAAGTGDPHQDPTMASWASSSSLGTWWRLQTQEKGASQLTGSSCFYCIFIIYCRDELRALSFPAGFPACPWDSPKDPTPSHQHHLPRTAAAPARQTTPVPPATAAFCPSTSLIPNQLVTSSACLLAQFPEKTGLRIQALCLSASRTIGQFQLNVTERWRHSHILVSYIMKISRQVEK